MAPKNKQFKRVYFDPKRVGSYRGVLRRVTRVPRKVVEEWLSEQDGIPYTNRREFVSTDDASSWEVDFGSGRPISSTCGI